MKPISTFCVIPDLPDALARIWDVSHNLWWTWSQEAVHMFHQMDPDAWRVSGSNPLAFLSSLDASRAAGLVADPAVAASMDRVTDSFDQYSSRPSWFETTCPDSRMKLAYFSLEFGLGESLPIYSGGLGVLAGDHLKSASDLGLPLVGVGLLYRQGYFRQLLSPDGWQLEQYPETDADQLPIRRVTNASGDLVVVEVSFPTGPVYAQVWSVDVGRCKLYLLDTNTPENAPDDRNITASLYGGDRQMRVRQEIVLGIGGIRALEALDMRPTLCHMNEGHSAFLALERVRLAMEEHGFDFATAREACAAGNIFTTHTPVAAGNDWFPSSLIDQHLAAYGEQLGLTPEALLGLGRIDPADADSDFCMTIMALRLSASSNGVSRLHGEVSRQIWSSLWPRVPATEVPITSITNGVHTESWMSPHMARLLDRHLGLAWREAPGDPASWQGMESVPDRELWETRCTRRHALIEDIRRRLGRQLQRQEVVPAKLSQTLEALDPEALTIGFARRFATYKRGSLILRDSERLGHLLADPERPVQILFAGKAHPHDHAGKELIRDIVSMSRRPPFSGRVFFLEDYDMDMARYLVQGCDVWLNNPRRPEEASGTSGMKAALNGGLQISVLDGWWVEACDLHAGWTIGRGEVYEDLDYQDDVESSGLYDLLETEVIPLFHERGADGIPTAWVSRVKQAIAAIAPAFSSHRMVREYVDELYTPNQKRWEALNGDPRRPAEFSQWKARVRAGWSQVKVEAVETDAPTQPRVGMRLPLRATVALGDLSPSDVRVELYMGKLNPQHEIAAGSTQPLTHVLDEGGGRHGFAGTCPCPSPGSFGYTLRVLPHHPDMRDPLEMGLVLWA